MRQLEVLLVEDNADHVELVRRSLDESNPGHRLTTVEDGRAALDYLHQSSPYDDSERYLRPDLILLDLRLPKVSGLDVLREIKSSTEINQIPVIVLTTSAHENDIAQAYQSHANSYVIKPVTFDKFARLMREMSHFWFDWNSYPPREEVT